MLSTAELGTLSSRTTDSSDTLAETVSIPPARLEARDARPCPPGGRRGGECRVGRRPGQDSVTSATFNASEQAEVNFPLFVSVDRETDFGCHWSYPTSGVGRCPIRTGRVRPMAPKRAEIGEVVPGPFLCEVRRADPSMGKSRRIRPSEVRAVGFYRRVVASICSEKSRWT